MKKIMLSFMILLIVFSFGLHILGLLNLIPIYLTSPLLLLSFLLFFYYFNERKRFRGFR
ncbi:hypothetical protein [Aeribacillus pallidus]|jgi:hypothetical protein|uniref:hypothetical protein n=1 Tax=Aeribacillus pallidus TaxID=33936 RepID=UPI003D255B28